MALDIDVTKYEIGLKGALELSDELVAYGREMARKGFNKVYFVGCGAPNRELMSIKYWVDHYSKKIETHLFWPAEFISQNPARIDDKSLVILMSHSGTTKEIVQAAKFCHNLPCTTVAMTMKADAPLAMECSKTFAYGESKTSYDAKFVLILSFISGMMDELKDWDLHGKIMQGLKAFPKAMTEAELQYEKINTEHARNYWNEDFFMVLGSGPCHATSYGLGVCVMMESLNYRVFEGQAAEFFHGPFEVLNNSVPVILFIGEDLSRGLAERVETFVKNYTEKLLIYDSKDIPMEGIPAEVRGIFAPYILGAASNSLPKHMSVWKAQPLSTRHYMGKVSY